MFDLGKVEKEVSRSPMKPGCNISAILEKVEVSQSSDTANGGDLDFFFKGTSLENAGNFKARFWANSFDSKEDKFKQSNADNFLKQIRQICEAYLPEDVVVTIKGSSWGELRNKIVEVFSANSYDKTPVLLKLVYKYNSDKDLVLPNYGSFISSEMNVKGLSISDKLGSNGMPYDRILPMSTYASPEIGLPVESNFSVDEDFDFPIAEADFK